MVSPMDCYGFPMISPMVYSTITMNFPIISPMDCYDFLMVSPMIAPTGLKASKNFTLFRNQGEELQQVGRSKSKTSKE